MVELQHGPNNLTRLLLSTQSPKMPEEKQKKIGQEFGEIRQSVDVDALNRYLSCELSCGSSL